MNICVCGSICVCLGRYICMYTCVCMCICICMHVLICVYNYIFVYLVIHAIIHIHALCKYVYTYMHLINEWVCVYVCMCMKNSHELNPCRNEQRKYISLRGQHSNQ